MNHLFKFLDLSVPLVSSSAHELLITKDLIDNGRFEKIQSPAIPLQVYYLSLGKVGNVAPGKNIWIG